MTRLDPRVLSKRERQVCDMVIQGLANKTIAYMLHISTKTVESHRARVMEKYGVRSLPELVMKAWRPDARLQGELVAAHSRINELNVQFATAWLAGFNRRDKEIQALRVQRDAAQAEIAKAREMFADTVDRMFDDISALRAECEGLRTDAERYRWLPCPFPGNEWRHGNGYLFCGSMRIACADLDTIPPPALQGETFDWMCQQLNRRPPVREIPTRRRRAPGLDVPRVPDAFRLRRSAEAAMSTTLVEKLRGLVEQWEDGPHLKSGQIGCAHQLRKLLDAAEAAPAVRESREAKRD